MSYHNILRGEISSLIDEVMKKKQVLIQDRITNIICSRHTHELKEDAPFSTYNISANVRREVGQVMNKKLLGDSSKKQQLVIKGLDRIQKYYSIERGGEIQGVPLELISKKEGIAKGKELIKTGKGFVLHGRQLVEYFEKVAEKHFQI